MKEHPNLVLEQMPLTSFKGQVMQKSAERKSNDISTTSKIITLPPSSG